MKNALYLSATVCGLLLGSAELSAAPSPDAAYDVSDRAIVDQYGNCVRTQWTSATDPCAPPPVAAPEPKLYLSQEARTLFFAFDSAELTDTAKAKLDELARIVNASQAIKEVHIVGYTDQFGTDDYNRKLAQRRIDAVIAYGHPLIRADLKAEQRDVRAEGKAPPEAACFTIKKRQTRIDCMQGERRVEIELSREYSK